MAAKKIGMFTVVEARPVPRAPRNGARESKPLSEEVLTIAENLQHLFDHGQNGIVDVVGGKTVRRFIKDARKAAEHVGLGLSVGVQTAEGVMRATDLPQEDDGVTYRLELGPKVKTERTRKTDTEDAATAE